MKSSLKIFPYVHTYKFHNLYVSQIYLYDELSIQDNYFEDYNDYCWTINKLEFNTYEDLLSHTQIDQIIITVTTYVLLKLNHPMYII